MLARWLLRSPKFLILEDPTQGVDIGAKAEIHGLIEQAASGGVGVLVLSTDHSELARLCNRVHIIRGGEIVDELVGSAITVDRLTAGTVGATIEHDDRHASKSGGSR
jgi:ribose transport system ATP-binding protein